VNILVGMIQVTGPFLVKFIKVAVELNIKRVAYSQQLIIEKIKFSK